MPGLRTVEVQSPSKSQEGFIVLMVATGIVLCALYSLAFRVEGKTDDTPAQRDSLPFQVFFRDLPSPQQRIFRELQEGFTEAVRLRTPRRVWPTADELAAQGIPPFAKDPIDRSGTQWRSGQEQLLVNYLGVPAEGNPSFLLVIVEPDPETGERPGAAPLQDAEHQLLPDGKTLLHVTYWMKAPAQPAAPAAVQAAAPAAAAAQAAAATPGSTPLPALVASPALAGWTQIRFEPRIEEKR